jgi:hypothetical protein
VQSSVKYGLDSMPKHKMPLIATKEICAQMCLALCFPVVKNVKIEKHMSGFIPHLFSLNFFSPFQTNLTNGIAIQTYMKGIIKETQFRIHFA